LYRRGAHTIRVGGIETAVPIVAAVLRQVGRELETPLNDSFCNAYTSPVGARTAIHFDEQDVFIVQISGRKLWRIAPNRSVRAPAFGYSGGPLGRLERAQLSGPLPRGMPRSAIPIETSPGTVIFLPRGTWHETRALEDSLALTMSYSCSSWLDVLLMLLGRSLVLKEEWRETAVGLTEGSCDSRAALDHFDRLIGTLGHRLAATGSRGIVRGLPGP
jgi:50S ribosomal protein L16 3-hydroxylase